MLQYIFSKWTLACLVGLLTGIIATLINLAIENIAGYKLLKVVEYIKEERLVFSTSPQSDMVLFVCKIRIFMNSKFLVLY